MQSKNKSIVESLTNTVTGLLTSFLIQIIIYPYLDIPVTFGQNVLITLVFFIASFMRCYLIRRIFNKSNKNK